MSTKNEKLKSAHILIVDDKSENVEILEGLLSISGFSNVQSTTDPRTVASLFVQGKFDLLLLDIRMPHMDGFQVMEQLQEFIVDDYLPVLVLTAETEKETKNRALELGAKDFVQKPFDHSEVINRIRNMLEVRMLYNERRDRAKELEIKVEERTRQLVALQDVTMVAMGSLAETRDNETGNHIRRTQLYIKALAESLAGHPRFQSYLTPENITRLYKSAPLHDIGKVGIPDHILLKPATLTDKEFEVMKTHAALGGESIKRAEAILDEHENESFLSIAREVAESHHEKWDGSGYPYGLAGDGIPLSARLMAIADVYDALISARPYKDAKPHEVAVDIMTAGRGSHFDPDIFDAFISIQNEFRQIASEYVDEALPD